MISRRTMMNDEIVSRSGNIAQLEKCKGSYLNGLQLFGKSEQFKTNGLQLYNGSTITLAPSNSSTGFTYATEYLLDVIKKLPAGVYSVSYTLKETGDLGTGVGKITLQDSLNNMLVNALNTFELTDDIKNKVEKVALYGRVKSPSTVVNFMLNAGNKPKPYEPYTGGIPAPNIKYPQEIVNSGDNGQVGIGIFGSNLFDKATATSGNIKEDGTIGRYGEIGKADNIISDYIPCIENTNYRSLKMVYKWAFYDSEKRFIKIETNKSVVNTPAETKYFVLMYSVGKIMALSYADTLMVSIGTVVLPYEPYKPGQFLTIFTPNGLPGIPVSKDGNYTDENGQQWVCDEIDLGREKYVQRIAEQVYNKINLMIIDESNNKFQNASAGTYKFKVATYPSMSNFAHYVEWANNKGSFAAFDKYFYYRHTEKITVDELNTLFNSMMPVKILGQLETPIERDLTAEEVAAYKALHTYTGTTVLGNDAEVYMKATYRKFK